MIEPAISQPITFTGVTLGTYVATEASNYPICGPAPEHKEELPIVITCTQTSKRGMGTVALMCETSIHNELEFYRGFERDYDRYTYIRADHHRHAFKQIKDQAKQLVIAGAEISHLKDEIETMRHLLNNE